MADSARRAAYDVLAAVRTADAYANLELTQVLAKHRLSGRDAAFTTELVAGTLRHRRTYDEIVSAAAGRRSAKIQPPVLDVLRLGAHQVLSMRVPPHAAISTSVDLVRGVVGKGPTGFVNAVLRKIAGADLATWIVDVAPDPAADPLGHAGVVHSHPDWVVAEFASALAVHGRGAELSALLAADNDAPSVVVVARPGRCDRAELPGEPTTLSPYGVRLTGGDPKEITAIADGRAGVQDEGSQLVAIAAAQAPLDGSDRRWLDVCAGPGGKTALLAGLATARGATVVANELQPHRAELVRHALRGADGVEEVVVADGTDPPWPAGSFDRVLVDAPCSGLGALRRRPESRWRRTLHDVGQLVPLQERLLDAACTSVRPGGLVLYATCSPVLAETSGVVESVLARRDDVVVEDLAGVLPQVTDAAGPLPGTMQLWPHRHGTDAMFMALLRRR